jgi:hypothetical protein
MKKTDVPKATYELLGITWSDKLYTSKETISGGGETVTKRAWEVLYARLQELKKEGKLII